MTQPDFFPDLRSVPGEVPNERYTPRSVFVPLDREFGFTIDACATCESAKCLRFWTQEDDGLRQSWAGERVWCNPPYDNIEAWVRKARDEAEAGLVVMLLPAWTDRAWWQELVEPHRDSGVPFGDRRLRTRFLPGRVRFGIPGNPEGKGMDSPPFWSVLLVWERVGPPRRASCG